MSRLKRVDLAQFTGDAQRYQHHLVKDLLFTTGVHYLAESGEAWWLVDTIASYFGTPAMQEAIEQDPMVGRFQYWRLDVHADCSATLLARADASVPAFLEDYVPYTDFPLGHIDLWAAHDGSWWTLYLPSEH